MTRMSKHLAELVTYGQPLLEACGASAPSEMQSPAGCVTFTIPGKPQPWRRSRQNGKRHFKDAKTQANQDAWAWAARLAMGAAQPLTGPLRVTIHAAFPIPVRTTKANRAAMLANTIRPTQRPDADNIAKNVDGLNGVTFVDDAQITDLIVRKFYSDAPRVDVSIVEV